MPATLSAEAKKNIQATLDASVKDTGVPGLVFCAVDKEGNYLSQAHSGQIGLKHNTPMSQDSVFWMASCTKIITAIACMQLSEQGKLALDDAQALYKLCPEIENAKKVLVAPGKYEDRKGDITLRMLLTHTAGFGYTFFNERLRDFKNPAHIDEFKGDWREYRDSPLVNQPGSRWEYGSNIDWAGVAVERASGMRLDDYFKKNIFTPLAINDISFLPSEEMIKDQVICQQRDGDTTAEMEHPYKRALSAATQSDKDSLFQSGGAGCFGRPKSYVQILAMLLNDGASAKTGSRILKAETVKEMFTNQIPQFPDFARTPIPAAKPALTNSLPELYPQPGNPAQGWGLSCMLTQEAGQTGRGPMTGWWAGIVNLFWWCDREKGVAGMMAGQMLPFGDPNIMGAWGGCEAAVYSGLSS